MKKGIIIVLLVLLAGVYLLGLASCGTVQGLPYGVWRSDDPNLVLYLTIQSETGFFSGEYISGSRRVDVVVALSMNLNGLMDIFDSSGTPNNEEYLLSEEDLLFSGNIDIQQGKIVYTLISVYRDSTGYKTIIFEKIADYDPEASSAEFIDMPKKVKWLGIL